MKPIRFQIHSKAAQSRFRARASARSPFVRALSIWTLWIWAFSVRALFGLALLSPPDATAGSNDPPIVDVPPVYRSFPGFDIAYPIPATDPEGGGLDFSSAELPPGATLDPQTGLLSWTPGPMDTGAYEIPVEVADDGVPPLVSQEVFPFRITELDACTVPTCDPATGCSEQLLPIAQECCVEEPAVRVAEPAAQCPQGIVSHVGRNISGFGRLQNCDLVRIEPFGQGGAVVSLNIEARCMPNGPHLALVDARMETADTVLFDVTDKRILFDERSDGFHQQIGEIFQIDDEVSVAALNGEEAHLFMRISLVENEVTIFETELEARLVVTLEELGDLPEPDLEDIPSDEAGCVGCHRPLVDGVRHGIEEAHPPVPGDDLSCTDCHGGNGTASTRLDAHVSPGSGPSALRSLASDELDGIDPAYLRFINPGDLRIADLTCGLAGCHPEHVENTKLSTMSTYGGHYTLPRYLAGHQGREGEVAAVDVTDHDFDELTAPEGAVESLAALRGPNPAEPRDSLGSLIDDYLPKNCPTCHLNSFGRNQAAGTYRSSGCTACHMVYGDNGLSDSDDPTRSDFPPHPIKHELTTAMPVEQCAHCHFQGGRIGLHYRGIREGGFDAANTPEHAVPLGESLYGHGSDFYFTDEDSTNEVDETPPDLHFEAGMVCADCHVGGDVHGDGNLYTAERYQVGIRCEDCHGTVREEIQADLEDGLFKNSKGDPLALRRIETPDIVLLKLNAENREIYVPQIARLLAEGANPNMNLAMGVDEEGFSHTDSLECYACHTSWRLNCFGCHVTQDDRLGAQNRTTGFVTQGFFSAERDTYTTDFFALGQNRRGKLSPLCSSMSMFFTRIDEQGTTQYTDKIRTSGDGKQGFGWNPFHHHTVSRKSQDCNRCHPVVPGSAPENDDLVRATYGFGSGEAMAIDGDGTLYDLTRFLEEDGTLISDFPHPGTGPVPEAVRNRAMTTFVQPLYVPEPGSALLVGVALTVLLGLALRSRRSAEGLLYEAEHRARLLGHRRS